METAVNPPDNPSGSPSAPDGQPSPGLGQPSAPSGASPVDDVAGGLSIREAAAQLGVSEKVIRGRIQRGELQAQKVATAYGQQWRVVLDSPQGEPQIEPSGQPSDPGEGTRASVKGGPGQPPGQPKVNPLEVELRARLADKDGEIGRLVEQLGLRAAEAERYQVILMENARRLAALEAEVKELRALPPAPAEETAAPAIPIIPYEEPAPRRRAWWKLWG